MDERLCIFSTYTNLIITYYYYSYRPKRSQCAQQAEDAQNAEDLGTLLGSERDDDVEQRHEDEAAVHHVPTTPQVRVTTKHKTFSNYLQSTPRRSTTLTYMQTILTIK